MSKDTKNKNQVDDEILKTDTKSSDRRVFDVGPLLQAVKEIFDPPFGRPNNYSETDDQTDNTRDLFDSLSEKFYEIGDKIIKECTKEGHGTTISILNGLSNYSWGSKLAIALAAFAMNYAEFWLVQHGCLKSNSEIAKSIACLKLLRIDDLEKSKDGLKAMKEFLNLCLEIADKIIELEKFEATKHDDIKKEIENAKIYLAVYSTIMSILVCAAQIESFEKREILVLSAKHKLELDTENNTLKQTVNKLKEKTKKCIEINDEKKHEENKRKLQDLFGKENNDNIDSLKALISAKNNEKPLINKTGDKANIDVLSGKNVLLLISDLNILEKEITVLSEKYEKLQPPQAIYEIVWLPIIDNWNENEARYHELRAKMPSYSVFYPSLKDSTAMIEFIKNDWSFEKKPILVVINSKGKLVCRNALHMLWIWGNEAYPFDSKREEELWEKETWRLKLLVNDIDPTVSEWIKDKKYICLYGGVDENWIKKFTAKAKEVAKAAGILLEMVYVGKSNPKGRVDKNIRDIVAKNFSHNSKNENFIWFFWVRIASMWYSKLQLKKTPENDPIMKGVMRILSLDSEPSWAVLGHAQGTNEDDPIVAKGNIFLGCLETYDKWKEKEAEKFMSALRDELPKQKEDHHCNQLMLPSEEGKVGEGIGCPDCQKQMDKITLYRCCDEV